MPVMAELFRKKGRKLLIVGKVSIIVAHYERLSPAQKLKHYIKFDDKIYIDEDVENLKGK